jgi:type IV pilus assembly protein PilY1
VTNGKPRKIYYSLRTSNTVNTGTLREFTYSNLNFDGLSGLFAGACSSKSPSLSQCAVLGADKTTADDASSMVDYLRGGSNDTVYRARFAGDKEIGGGILGDVIGGAPIFVRSVPSFKYTENNYPGFAAAVAATNSNTGRPGVVYVASNDGMLHAFRAKASGSDAAGSEMWAYVPSMVMDRMYRLADKNYDTNHQYLVNGAPVFGDIYVPGSPGTWKTIVVGGLGAGGVGYYALDVTDPENPKALWEFKNDSVGGQGNLGLTFGNPVITKRADGKWVVIFSSGYNNHVTGDGNGRLFVVDANTGQRLLDIPTLIDPTNTASAAGTKTAPSGLGKINAWVDSEIDNTAKRIYGGDLLGNVWRFDLDNLVAPKQQALRLAYLSAGGVAQPVTTKPELAEVEYPAASGNKYPVVYVNTGKYLGTSDLGTTSTQSIYALKDPLTNTPLGDVHASSDVVAQTMTEDTGTSARIVSENAVDWAVKSGWRVDLLSPGERVNIDMLLVFNTVTIASIIPSDSVCSAGGGDSYIYQLDIGDGRSRSSFGSISGEGANKGAKIAGRKSSGLIVGLSWITLKREDKDAPAGSGKTISLPVNGSTGFQAPFEIPPGNALPPGGRRTSWRELVN